MKRVYTGSPEIQRMQDLIAESVEQLERSPMGKGVLLEGVSLSTGASNRVNHKLGRVPSGWIIVDRDDNANVWSSTSSLPNKFLELSTSADVTVSLWIF